MRSFFFSDPKIYEKVSQCQQDGSHKQSCLKSDLLRLLIWLPRVTQMGQVFRKQLATGGEISS